MTAPVQTVTLYSSAVVVSPYPTHYLPPNTVDRQSRLKGAVLFAGRGRPPDRFAAHRD